jgi:TRAP-type C4-dicarboxylate transport system permease small subunit
MTRRVLNGLYAVSGALAALFLALIFAVIIVQVAFNTIDRIAGLMFGQAIGLAIPSYADFAGFFLAATSFLGLAATLRAGDLIRVNLLLQRLAPGARRAAELLGSLVGACISGFATVHAVLLAMDAWRFNELSTGIIAVPMWIPQLAFIAGLGALTIAFVDGLVCCVRYGTLLEPQESTLEQVDGETS